MWLSAYKRHVLSNWIESKIDVSVNSVNRIELFSPESECSSHRWRIDLCRFRWPWVTLKGRTRGVNYIRRISIIKTRTVWHRNDQIRQDNTCREEYICSGSATPIARRQGPSAPPISGVLVYFCNSIHPLTQIYTKIEVVTLIGRGLVFRGQPFPYTQWGGAPPLWGGAVADALKIGPPTCYHVKLG